MITCKRITKYLEVGKSTSPGAEKKNKTSNIKRKAVLIFMYSEGLKVGEVVWLQPKNIGPLDTV